MIKKLFSLLFAAIIFLSGTAVASADIRFFVDMKINAAAAVNIIENDVYFAKDYSKIITDVYKNFVNDIVSLTALAGSSRASLKFKNNFKEVNLSDRILIPNQTEKKISLIGSFVDLSHINISKVGSSMFFVLIFMFILWYIGLLRIFRRNSFFAKQIEV